MRDGYNMKKETIKFAAKLSKRKSNWCYACGENQVQWDGKKFVCKSCGAVHESVRSCRE